MQRDIEAARKDPRRVVLEGAHALKHALRFGAIVDIVVSPDVAALRDLLTDLAPDVVDAVDALVEPVDATTWARLTHGGLPSPALAVARRPDIDVASVTAAASGRLVLLDGPAHLGNVGAVVRVAAAAAAAGVIVTGTADPWHPVAVRGGAGLQFALPVGRLDRLPATERPVVAIDPGGTPLPTATIPPDAVVAFGSERRGLSETVRARADRTVAIPMRRGVSSLNLATAVAVVLYGDLTTSTVEDASARRPSP